ncbi:MAG TPA: glycosyltransferase family 2 protein [Candidatus Saccharimonadales bacterium]|nr:glycosyltransferase family 2 protein [Candidatus Saccharimonadales bacterium]
MSHSKLVSVIIPCYNYGNLLPKAIDSVIAQTYKNIEIIIIDDGSTDDTESVAKTYSSEYQNVYYHKQKNMGIVKTRNKCVNLAKGYYLIQLDADDWIDNSYVEKAVNLAEDSNADIVYSDVIIFGRVNRKVYHPEHNIEILKYQNYIHASALVKKTVFSTNKYDEVLESLGYEDWDLFLGACLSGKTARKMTGPVLHYKKHNQPRSRSDVDFPFKQALDARIYIYEKYYKKYPEAMKSLEPINQLFVKIQNKNEILLKKRNELKNSNNHALDRIKTLEREITLMKQSKFWKARDKYHKVRRYLGIDGK